MVYVTCKKCMYDWDYRGKLKTATCSNCLNKVNIKQSMDAKHHFKGLPEKILNKIIYYINKYRKDEELDIRESTEFVDYAEKLYSVQAFSCGSTVAWEVLAMAMYNLVKYQERGSGKRAHSFNYDELIEDLKKFNTTEKSIVAYENKEANKLED